MEFTFNFAKNRSVIKIYLKKEAVWTLAYSRIYDSANQTVFFSGWKKVAELVICMGQVTKKMKMATLS
jgi:Ni,Fe-hydrogenase III small subunit